MIQRRRALLALVLAFSIAVGNDGMAVFAEEEPAEAVAEESADDSAEKTAEKEAVDSRQEEAPEEAGNLLVVFEEGISEKKAKRAIEDEDLPVEKVEKITDTIAEVTVPGNISTEEAVETLEKADGVVSAEPDYVCELDGYTNDPEISSAKYHTNKDKYHYIYRMGLAGPGKTAWDYATGKGVKVAVIDAGTNVHHRDLQGNVAEAYNAVTDEEGLSHVSDANGKGHGSMTAGILAAAGNNGICAAGVAYNAKLYVVKVQRDSDSTTLVSHIIKGMKWAADKGCRVISMSISHSEYSEAEAEAIRYANEKGAVVVCSAGNTGKHERRYPASCDGVVAVAALDYPSNSGYSILSGTTYNDRIDIAAPGKGLYGVSNTSNTHLLEGGKTSAATPYVAGVAAMLFQANPLLTPEECVKLLTSTATDAGAAGYDMHYGYGIINPLAAVQKAIYKTGSKKRSITGVPSKLSKTISAKSFYLSSKTEGSGVFSYKSSNTKVAKVHGGKISVRGIGKTTITVSIKHSGIFQSASAKMVLTVTPKKVLLKSAKGRKKKLTVKWEKRSGVTGYQITVAKNKAFTKKKRKIKAGKATSRTITNLPRGTWYVKVRAYKTVKGKRIYGPYSSVKKCKVKR